MRARSLAVAVSCLLLGACATTPRNASTSTFLPSCEVDRARLLALDEQAFDQGFSGGWRALADRPGCNLAAADLIRDYRQARRNDAGLLLWHEAQMRAFAGQSHEAIALMRQARRPAGDPDRGGWNPYVDATVAFLNRDRAALEQARTALAAVAVPSGEGAPVVANGVFDVDLGNGETRQVRWPPNIDVVDGLLQCFDRPYVDAYRDACRPPQ